MELAKTNRFRLPTHGKRDIEGIKNKIKDVDYFLFDFDGTIYPRFLLLDLALDFLGDYQGNKKATMESKYKKLIQLVGDKYKKSFLELSLEFAKILKDIPCSDFNKKIPHFLNDCYSGALRLIHALKQENKKCFLVSLTSEAVAVEVTKHVGFDNYWCRKLERTIYDNVEVFTGRYAEDVSDLSKFKKVCLSKFGINEDERFLMAGDGFEDILLFNLAYIKIGVNPEKKLLDSMDPDIILYNKYDPWHDF